MLIRVLRAFAFDKSASMATQVVIFSVMLFGMSGVVLDFGRVYNEHSRMQAFTDQAALAAARELDRKTGAVDGETNAILRAVRAVVDEAGDPVIAKNVAFGDQESGVYRISHLFFLRELSDDADDPTQFGDELLNGNLLYMYEPGDAVAVNSPDVIAAANLARYVVAVGEERSLRNSLMGLVAAAENSSVDAEQSIRTVSFAEVRQKTSASLSNLAVCNPWEGNAYESASSVLGDPTNAGIHFQFRAYGDNDPNVAQPNALMTLTDMQVSDNVRDVCGDPLRLPGYDPAMSLEEVERTTEICILAASRGDEQATALVRDEIEVSGADPETITIALNTVFDIWDEPIAAVLDWDLDADGDHSQMVDEDGNSLWGGASYPRREDSALFQPALNIAKGRVRDERLAVQNEATRPHSSRLNYPRTTDTANYELIIDLCVNPFDSNDQQCYSDPSGAEFQFTDTDGTARSYVSNPVSSAQLQEFYDAFYATHASLAGLTPLPTSTFQSAAYINSLALNEWRHKIDNVMPSPWFYFGPYVAPGESLTSSGEDASLMTVTPTTGVSQREMRRCVHDATGVPVEVDPTATGDAACAGYDGLDNNDGIDPHRPDANHVIARDSDDRERDYANFTWQPSSPENIASWDQTRRLLDVTLVNCGTADATSDGFNMEVETFAQLYLLTPPRVICPDGSENCANSDIEFVDIFAEFVGEIEEETEYYAVLVR